MPSTPPWTISRTSGAECYSRKKAGQRDEIGNLDCDRGLGAVLTLAGCTTTYVGQKLDPDGKLTKPGGVPFVLTKPEYTVAVTADAGTRRSLSTR